MRISICGTGDSKTSLLNHLIEIYGDNVVRTHIDNPNFPIVDYTSETFKHVSDEHVIYDGGIFDGFIHFDDDGKQEMQDQIILSYIENVDKIYVVYDNMSETDIQLVKEYEDIYPEKISFYSLVNPSC